MIEWSVGLLIDGLIDWLIHPVELTTYSGKWLTHTMHETKGLVIPNGWFNLIGVRVRVRVRDSYIRLVPRACQPFSRTCGKLPSVHRLTGVKILNGTHTYCSLNRTQYIAR